MKALQIVAVGGEWDRVVEIIRKYPSQKVIFLTSTLESTRKEAKALHKMVSPILDSEIKTIAYRDFELCMSQIKDILDENKGYDTIYANISAGTRIVAISLFILAQYYNIKIVYAVPQKYVKGGKFKTKGVDRIIEMPMLNLRNMMALSKSERTVLKIVSDRKKSFSVIVKEYAEKNKIRLDDLKIRDLKSRFSYTIKQLKEKNLVSTEIKDRKLYVSLSSTGKFILNMQGGL